MHKNSRVKSDNDLISVSLANALLHPLPLPMYCNAPRPFMHAFSLQGLDAEDIPIFTGCFQETKKIGLHTESDLLELLA